MILNVVIVRPNFKDGKRQWMTTRMGKQNIKLPKKYRNGKKDGKIIRGMVILHNDWNDKVRKEYIT